MSPCTPGIPGGPAKGLSFLVERIAAVAREMQELAARAHMLSLCAGNEIHDRRQLLVISDKFDDLAREAGAGVHTLQELSEELESIA